jgi:hypothetical protein
VFTYHDSLPDSPSVVTPQAILQLLQDIDRHGLSDNCGQPEEDALYARLDAMIKSLSSETQAQR